MVKQAADANLADSDDLDWKEQLPQPPREGRWNEQAEDVTVMASTRGGLLIYGVTDKTTAPVGTAAEDKDQQTAVVPHRDRDLDHSWSQIGQALGISRQAAWERYGKSRPEQASR